VITHLIEAIAAEIVAVTVPVSPQVMDQRTEPKTQRLNSHQLNLCQTASAHRIRESRSSDLGSDSYA